MVTELFIVPECSDDHPCEGLSKHAHFQNFGMAFLTLFRVATGDNWNGIMKVCIHVDMWSRHPVIIDDSKPLYLNHFLEIPATYYRHDSKLQNKGINEAANRLLVSTFFC